MLNSDLSEHNYEEYNFDFEQLLPQKPAAAAKQSFNLNAIDTMYCIQNQPDPLDFVLPGLVSGTCGGLISRGGTGKSFLVLELLFLIATGEAPGNLADYYSTTGKTGQVVYLSLEDPLTILHQRLWHIGKLVKPQSAALFSAKATILDGYGQGFSLESAGWRDYLVKIAEGKRLVVIDTLRRAHGADENNNGEMSKILNICESVASSTGAAVLLLHHVPKGSGNSSRRAAEVDISARGASSITDNLRYVAALQPVSPNDADAFRVEESERWKHIRFSLEKYNNTAPIPPLWLVRGEGGVLSCIGEMEKIKASAAATLVTRGRGGTNDDDEKW